MEPADNHDRLIATHSIEEGLDFGCNLLCRALESQGDADPAKAQTLLRGLAQYLSLRYAGELALSLEYLAGLGHHCHSDDYRYAQFWNQLRWTANKMGLTGSDLDKLALPSNVESGS
jgi:hypothetical protein